MRPTKDVLKHDTSILCKLAEPLHKLHEFSHNYEHPSCIDWERFSKRVEELKSSTKNSGKFNFIIIEGNPHYHLFFFFSTDGDLLFVSGHLLLSNRDMWPLFSKSISLTPRLSPSASESLARRRWSRDYKQTCTMEHFRQYWNAVIWPSYLEHGSSVPPVCTFFFFF